MKDKSFESIVRRARLGQPICEALDPRAQITQRLRQSFEVDHRRRQIRLDRHVPAAAPPRAVQSVLRPGLTVHAFHHGEMTPVQRLVRSSFLTCRRRARSSDGYRHTTRPGTRRIRRGIERRGGGGNRRSSVGIERNMLFAVLDSAAPSPMIDYRSVESWTTSSA